ncbi:MAG: META domain-containing protein [Planctomycetota bacterium]
MKWIGTLFLIVAGSVQVGCATGPGDWTDAAEREWTLTRIDGKPPLAERMPTLTLAADGRVAGVAGANRFFGTYAQPQPGRITFAALGSTRMFRDDPPGLMQQEQNYLATLGEIDAYRVTPKRLELRSGKKTRLVFEPATFNDAERTTPR